METTYHVVLETVGLYLCPVVQLVRGDILHIARHIVASICISAGGADGSHQFVVLVGDCQFGCFVRDAVYLMIDCCALCLVGLGAVNLKQCLNLVQHRLFLGIVLRTKTFRALEHKVLEVMRQTRCLGRVVLAAHTNRDVGLDARRFLVDSQIDFQTVVQRVDTALHGIAFHCLVASFFATRYHQHGYHRHRQHG